MSGQRRKCWKITQPDKIKLKASFFISLKKLFFDLGENYNLKVLLLIISAEINILLCLLKLIWFGFHNSSVLLVSKKSKHRFQNCYQNEQKKRK
jgi:hypothetical protein